MKLKYEPALDGLRAISALAVLFGHIGAPFLVSGGRGVDVFFVLSGYLITSILLGEAKPDLGLFWARRVRRLLPALVLVVAVTLLLGPLYPAGRGPRPDDVPLTLSYAMNIALAFGRGYSPFSHTWSLAQEMQFYLVWPLALAWLRRRSNPAALALSAWAVITVLRWSISPIDDAIAAYSPITHASGLMLGAWLALGGRLPVRGDILGPLLIALVFVDPTASAFGTTVAEIGTAALISDLVSRPSTMRRALSTPWLVALGGISYGIYLWHIPIKRLIIGWPWWAMAPVVAWASITMAALSYVTVERRFLRKRIGLVPAE